ncbi:hypothetical protein F4804DRAFT_34195 [Jackrogersella minutella]|nr:hypothetical protein F4804DRAFT_34195 [Jackrogersella minutella]
MGSHMRSRQSPTKTTTTQEYDRQIQIARRVASQIQLCQDEPMEDMRNAHDSVRIIADFIDRLRPERQTRPRSAEILRSLSSPTVKRHGSNNSSSDGSTRKSSSLKWNRSVGKEWAESPSGALWREISSTLEEVAAQFQGVSGTALNEFCSSREILDLGADFVRWHREGRIASEKPYWAAEDLFFDLQTVKQGDVSASRWTKARPEKRAEWDLADHLVRFVLLADAFRRKTEREDWSAWAVDFVTNIRFYLSVLRCFTVRDAKQRAAARGHHRERNWDRTSGEQEKRSSRSSYRFSLGSRGATTA